MTTTKLTIAVLGAGNIGGTLGRKWAAAGHQVSFGVNDPNGSRSQSLRAELGDSVKVGSLADALSTNPDVVVFALPGGAMEEAITANAAQLDGKVIIDAANRMGSSTMNSFAAFQQHTPRALVFRAFNSLGWENFAEPVFNGVQADLFYCGPDGAARATVEQMISAVGLRPICLGDVDKVALVDSVATLWFSLALGQKMGRHLAFKVLV